MTSQYVWIGIAIGVFFAGLGIGYAVFVNTFNPYPMMGQPQFFNQMMARNPQYAGQYMGYMMQNQQYMNQWFSQNPQYAGQYMGYMMQNPQLRQQMYGYMFQNKDFMYSMMGNRTFQSQYMGPWMMQNQQFQRQWGNLTSTAPGQAVPQSSPASTPPGFWPGPGMMYGRYSQAFKTVSIQDAEAATTLPTYAQVSKADNSITFNSQNVQIVPLSFMVDDAKNFTGSSPPSYANGDAFVIGDMIDPTLVLKAGTTLNVTSINLDGDMAHNFAIMSSPPPYPYMTMQGMMYGGVVAMMPVLPNDDEKAGYAYELSYQVTLSQPGTYWYVCTYPGHAQGGMYGKIVVQ